MVFQLDMWNFEGVFILFSSTNRRRFVSVGVQTSKCAGFFADLMRAFKLCERWHKRGYSVDRNAALTLTHRTAESLQRPEDDATRAIWRRFLLHFSQWLLESFPPVKLQKDAQCQRTSWGKKCEILTLDRPSPKKRSSAVHWERVKANDHLLNHWLDVTFIHLKGR